MKLVTLIVLAAAVAGSGCTGIQGSVSAYERGDYSTALIEFRPLAEEGYRLAQYTLGVMYLQGQGVPRDYHAAHKWFSRAAAQGVSQAQFELGRLYERGLGVPQDFVQAHTWINLATAAADPEDAAYYARERDTLALQMTPEQLANAQRRAREILANANPVNRR